jgi:hypothetical protein
MLYHLYKRDGEKKRKEKKRKEKKRKEKNVQESLDPISCAR